MTTESESRVIDLARRLVAVARGTTTHDVTCPICEGRHEFVATAKDPKLLVQQPDLPITTLLVECECSARTGTVEVEINDDDLVNIGGRVRDLELALVSLDLEQARSRALEAAIADPNLDWSPVAEMEALVASSVTMIPASAVIFPRRRRKAVPVAEMSLKGLKKTTRK